MDTRRFIGPDMRTALRTVREQLGPDAVILSNRRVAGGVEIVAAEGAAFDGPSDAGVEPREIPSAVVTARVQAPVDRLSEAFSPGPRAAAAPSSRDPLVEVRGELRELRNLFERQLSGTPATEGVRLTGVEGAAWSLLTRAGLPNDIVRVLLECVGRDADADALQDALACAIPEAGDVVCRGGVIAAVGPTGAGKTTTLCKLAVRHVLEKGRESLVLASADTARLGGADMLRAVARLLEVPFITAAEGESIASLLARAGDPELLLLDTPGASRRRPADAQRLQELSAAGVHSLLVLPSNAQLAWLDTAVGDYRAARPVAAVITKLDETVSLGEVVGVLLREGLPFAYVTDGPEIPDDLHVCAAAQIARRTLGAENVMEAQGARSVRPAVSTTNVARIA